MTAKDDDSWWLAGWTWSLSDNDLSERERDGDRPDHYWRSVRDAAPGEVAQVQAASSLLHRCLDRSSLADVRAAYETFREGAATMRELAASEEADPARIQRHDRQLQQQFGAWLTAFKAFDDRQSAWLSDLVGKTDPVYLGFKKMLSREFDFNFAYRLSVAVRNVSEHQENVLRVVIRSGSSGVAGGKEIRTVSMRIDGPALARRAPRMRSATRAELAAATSLIDVEKVVTVATGSCDLLHGGLLRLLWPRIERAIEQVKSVGAEVEAVDPGAVPIYVPHRLWQEVLSSTPQPVDMVTVPLDVATAIDTVTRSEMAAQSRVEEAPEVGLRDLVCDD